MTSNPRSVSFRDFVTHRQEGMDGLGDRDRSLSPEGDAAWETLFTTLTPDPQPPSVGSSFASVNASGNASQSAIGSSRTSFTGPETADEVVDEQPCESGCDNSDSENEDDTLVPVPLQLSSHLFPLGSRANSVPEYNLDGPVDVASMHRRPYLEDELIYERRWPSVPPPTSHERSRLAPGIENAADGNALTESDAPANNSSGNNASNSQGDEDAWGGMQRIVRNLAAREDIPDEWWAEAGLSRTLPQDSSS